MDCLTVSVPLQTHVLLLRGEGQPGIGTLVSGRQETTPEGNVCESIVGAG